MPKYDFGNEIKKWKFTKLRSISTQKVGSDIKVPMLALGRFCTSINSASYTRKLANIAALYKNIY